MKKVTIQVEARVKYRKVIEMPDDEAAEFSQASDEDIICNIDEHSDIEEIDNFEVVDVHVGT